MKQPKIKWYAVTEHVDEDTGELIWKWRYDSGEYIKVRTEKRTELKDNQGLIKYTIIVKKNPQQKLEL